MAFRSVTVFLRSDVFKQHSVWGKRLNYVAHISHSPSFAMSGYIHVINTKTNGHDLFNCLFF